jgi:hypothetical protein
VSRGVKLGGKPPGPMPKDGRAYVVVDGKWVAIAHDGADGVPARLDLPDKRKAPVKPR